jgi:hypothetical protein
LKQVLPLAIILALCATGAQAQKSPDAEAEIRAANTAEVQDFLTADSKALGGLWADSFVVTNPLNLFVTKAQVLSMVDSGVLRFNDYERTVEYVRTYGDIAVVAGKETVVWSGKMPLAGKTSRLRFTAVWQRSAAGWQEIARHANIVPQP